MVDVAAGPDSGQPADDIRSSLAAALAEHEASNTEPAAVAKPAEPEKPGIEPAEAEVAAKTDERERGPDGKFIKAKGDGEAEAEQPEAKAEADDTKPAEEGKAKTESALEPHSKWSAADKEMFRTLAEPAQKFLLDRHKAMEADYTRKTQAIAAFKSEYEPVDKMFEPYRDTMRQKGFTPRSLIESWANVEKELASGPDGATRIVAGLVRGYNIPAAKVAAALGLTARAAENTERPDGQQPPVPEHPQEIQLPPAILRELQTIKQQVTGLSSAHEARIANERAAGEARVMNEIDKFKSAKDDKGTLLRPHFEEVEDDMTALANAAIAARQPVPSLQDLYDRAVWANPSTREQLRTAERQSADQKRNDEARAKAAAAKKAAASVSGAPGPGQAPNGKAMSDLSLREQLEQAAADSAA